MENNNESLAFLRIERANLAKLTSRFDWQTHVVPICELIRRKEDVWNLFRPVQKEEFNRLSRGNSGMTIFAEGDTILPTEPVMQKLIDDQLRKLITMLDEVIAAADV